MEKISREKFIRLGSALGVGAATASLVACGGGSGGGSGGSSGGDSGGSGGQEKAASSAASEKAQGGGGSEETKQAQSSQASEEAQGNGGSGGQEQEEAPQANQEPEAGGAAIAQESAVAPGSAVKFKEGGQPAVLVHLDSGDFVAYSAICTHQGCTVAYSNDQLVCPCHGSIFDPANGGAVVTGPAATPLPEIPVTVSGGQVLRG